MPPMERSFPIWVAILLTSSAAFAQESEQNRHTDSRARFVHRINLWDEDGRNISMKDTEQRPYSPTMTCARCHPTILISHGWHFNATDRSAPPGRGGEPWMYQDATTRTLLPISHREWPGTWSPKDVGLSDWQFVLLFGRHHPGGGPGLHPTTQPVDPKARWDFSGRLEVDCMICHSADNSHDPAERARQIELQQNFKWAATVAMGLAHVPGSARTLKIEPPEEGPNEPPKRPTLKMTYDKTKFDVEDKVLFNVARKVPNNRCYYCHTAIEVGKDVPPRWQHDGDVHLVKGMTCTDCHREAIDHMTTRGYEWEHKDRADAGLATLTCRGCHLGARGSGGALTAGMGGKLGSPRPEHRGLPAIHFEKLSCTACHSGPWPQMQPGLVQTSMAHALGLEKPTRNSETVPRILQPIFIRGADGKIAPHRAVWPNYFGRMGKESIAVIPPSVVKEAAGDEVLPAVRELTADASKPLSDEQISKTLAALSTGAAATQPAGSSGQAVYVSGGVVFGLDKGKVVKISSERAEAQPYEWAFAHDIRPASQSLGIRGCTDCHSSQGAIYFGEVTPVGAFAAGNGVTRTMTELRGESTALANAGVGSFMGRSLFKVLIFICGGVVAAVLLTAGVRGLGAWLVRES